MKTNYINCIYIYIIYNDAVIEMFAYKFPLFAVFDSPVKLKPISLEQRSPIYNDH